MLLSGEIKTPPMSERGRQEAGELLRLIQEGESVGMPHSRPMPSIGPRCHELRLTDRKGEWRIFYRIDADALLVVDVHSKKTQKTPKSVLDNCRARLKIYDDAARPKPKPT